MQGDSQFGALVSLTPLIVLVLVVWLVVRLVRKRAAAAPPREQPVGIGGWLGFFVISSCFLSPAVLTGKLMQAFTDTEAKTPGLANMAAWVNYKTVGWMTIALYVCWVWWV